MKLNQMLQVKQKYIKNLKLITQIMGLTKDETWLNRDVDNWKTAQKKNILTKVKKRVKNGKYGIEHSWYSDRATSLQLKSKKEQR